MRMRVFIGYGFMVTFLVMLCVGVVVTRIVDRQTSPEPVPLLPLTSSLFPEGSSQFVFERLKMNEGKPLDVFTYRAPGLHQDAPVLFVIHGASRNASVYRDDWIDLANRYGVIIIAPRFSKEDWVEYALGNVYRRGVLLPEPQWLGSITDELFRLFITQSNSTQTQYDLYGFSGGGQAVHRMVWTKPSMHVRKVVAAGAGWYTWPDYAQKFPYGFANTFISKTSLNRSFALPMLIIVGENDNDPQHPLLSRTAGAMLQGTHRFERAQQFFIAAQTFARTNKMPFNWSYESVPNIGHHNGKMAPFAAQFLYGTPPMVAK